MRYDVLYEKRFNVLKKAYANSHIETDAEYNNFVQENADWLPDYALFMAIKDSKKGKSYLDWEDPIRLRYSDAMVAYRNKLIDDVNFYQFLQYEFFRQWSALKKYANQKGIQIIGDIPIYVALDSADTWAHPELFQFDEKGAPIGVAGCPPDAFSATGQLWGNPLYDWSEHEKQGYQWWLERIRNCYKWYDMVRIDHFRGFDEYYAIPYENHAAVYTGTHDNATTYGWWDELTKADKNVALRYMDCSRWVSKKKLTWKLVCLAMSSVSDLCVIPLQDYLCLSNKARINTPSTLGGNWQWRMTAGSLSDHLCEKIRKMTNLYGRLYDKR